jgi:hypothetical protein
VLPRGDDAIASLPLSPVKARVELLLQLRG